MSRYRTRSDQLFSANPSQMLGRLSEIGGLQAAVESLLPLTARPYNIHYEMVGGQAVLGLYAGGEPLKARRLNADGTYTAMTIAETAAPVADQLGWQRDPATAVVDVYTNAADTQMVALEFTANAFKPTIVELLNSGAPS